MEEVSRVLKTKFGAGSDMVETVILLLKQDTILSQPSETLDLPIHDKDDLVILASALAGKADVLVTGDKELLALGSLKALEIITPRQFWEKIVGQYQDG
ncbi:MAG: putative toxin-antitoxin system toxin component, PIN family [Deltaproteobacteria bacterium]|nr:putative toxin-antitoxin system toxin component, PIN family [Deltaproteobacteria bacterium]